MGQEIVETYQCHACNARVRVIKMNAAAAAFFHHDTPRCDAFAAARDGDALTFAEFLVCLIAESNR